MRHKRSPLDSQVARPTVMETAGAVTAATEKWLEDVGGLDTALGQQALVLARRIDSPAENGSGVAALSREFREVLRAVGGKREADPLDELRARRDRRGYGRG